MRTKRSTSMTPRKRAMPDSYSKAVEEFRLWSDDISAREEDFKKGRTPRDWHEPRTTRSREAMIAFAVVTT